MSGPSKFFLSVAQTLVAGMLGWLCYSVHDLSKDVAVLKDRRCHCEDKKRDGAAADFQPLSFICNNISNPYWAAGKPPLH